MEAMKKSIYTKESDFLRKWLTKKRHEADLSQRQFATLLNVDYSIVAKIESGGRQIGAIELVQYCEALNVDPVEAIEELKLLLRTNDSRLLGKKDE